VNFSDVCMSQASSVTYGMGDWDFIPDRGRDFSLCPHWLQGFLPMSSGADHSPCVVQGFMWSYISTSFYISHRDYLMFTLHMLFD
jgi:hypothetical protein